MRYVKQILIRQEDACMFFDYARPNYNVNNRRCVYPEIEIVYTFFLGLLGGHFEHGGFK